MQTRIVLSFAVFIFLTLLNSVAQTGATKKVLLTLQPGEKIVNNESCLDVNYSANQLQLVTKVGDIIYYYENGKRNGPFKSFDEIKIPECGTGYSTECAVFKQEQTANPSDLLTYTENGEMAIKFKGKTYGPYKMITVFYVSADKSQFVALAADNDMKYSVVSSDQPVQVMDGTVSDLHVSVTCKNYLAIVKEGEGIDPELLKVDYSKLSNDELMKLMQKQAEKQKNAGPPKGYVYTKGSKKFGPYPAESLSSNNPAFSKTGGENWYMIIDNSLYINGVSVKQFSYDDINLETCKVWLSPDGKRYAIVTYNKILFSDGSSYPSPLKIATENRDGKTVFKWVSLENEENIAVYSKEL